VTAFLKLIFYGRYFNLLKAKE